MCYLRLPIDRCHNSYRYKTIDVVHLDKAQHYL